MIVFHYIKTTSTIETYIKAVTHFLSLFHSVDKTLLSEIVEFSSTSSLMLEKDIEIRGRYLWKAKKHYIARGEKGSSTIK
jgi:hypothetical protein